MVQLRATRYLTAKNEPLKWFVLNRLRTLDLDQTLAWYQRFVPQLDDEGLAFLGANDRFFLLAFIMRRQDMLHPWIFARCREVEKSPDGHIDLWSRFHYKSSIITLGGAIQEMIADPEITIVIFSVVKTIAQEFLAQIKNELETNDHLKRIYSDVFYADPRTKGKDGRPAKWSIARGITVKRVGKPKEATVEAHGLIDGQPVGRHFKLHIYDDIVTQDHLGEDQLKKTIDRWEMADNLGTSDGARKWIAGTRYHFADAYSTIITRKSAKPRIYPATDNGKLTGDPVLLSPERWAEIKRDQRSTVSAQMLLNPIAGTEATFRGEYLRTYDVIPAVMNVYIMVDPSKGRTQRSDRTAIAVVGMDPGGNKYLLDGVCHRMKLAERMNWMIRLKEKWQDFPGVQQVHVGYEQYGMQSDLEVIEDNLIARQKSFEIIELNTPLKGGDGKDDRIERLEPDVTNGRWYMPAIVYHPEIGGKDFLALWKPWTEEDAAQADLLIETARKEGRAEVIEQHSVGHIIYRPMGKSGFTKAQLAMAKIDMAHRIVKPIKRRDEVGRMYDLTMFGINEMLTHPFAQHDDFIDSASRIFDMSPVPPIKVDTEMLMPFSEDRYAGTDADAEHYDA